jgi:hypothetical protein
MAASQVSQFDQFPTWDVFSQSYGEQMVAGSDDID